MTHATPTETPVETAARPKRPFFPHAVRLLALPIVFFWIAVAVLVNVIAPQLEVVGEMHSAPMAPEDAPSMKAMKLMGGNFKEVNTTSPITVVLRGKHAQ